MKVVAGTGVVVGGGTVVAVVGAVVGVTGGEVVVVVVVVVVVGTTGDPPWDATVNVVASVTTGSYPILVARFMFSVIRTLIVGFAGCPVDAIVAGTVVP